MTFEQSSKRIEEIVKKLEKGNIDLEEGTKLFIEGVQLSKECIELINKNKGKVVAVKNELDKLLESEYNDNNNFEEDSEDNDD